MKIKPDWLPLLHAARSREIELIFRAVPDKTFGSALELGAGDGFQSRLLIRYARNLIATEMNQRLLPSRNTTGVEYRVCDAEEVGETFEAGTFDLIFSSNLLEHLPDVGRALRGMHRVLRDDGVAIHLMPSPVWKLTHLACFPIDVAARNIEALSTPDRRRQRLQRLRTLMGGAGVSAMDHLEGPGNNIKLQRGRRGLLARMLTPEPHGVSMTNLAEFYAFRRTRWEQEFRNAGFDVISVLKGPVTSGYGFGLEGLRTVAERVGLTSEYVYIISKRGSRSAYASLFSDERVATVRRRPKQVQ